VLSSSPPPKQREFKPQKLKEKTHSSKQKHLDGVNDEDKLTGEEVLEHLNALMEYEAEIQDHNPVHIIEGIFNKIQNWKEKMGDQAE
jgi:hypothetical protein